MALLRDRAAIKPSIYTEQLGNPLDRLAAVEAAKILVPLLVLHLALVDRV
jgi:hypothetical protein